MVIKSLTVKANFKYLWLKRITGIDLSQHCAKCLLGKYDSRILTTVQEYNDLDLVDGIYYLCGVSEPYVWSNNFHLAFTNGDDTIDYTDNGIHIVIENAKRLPITEDASTILNLPKYKYKSYRTCRNWRFANWLKYSGIF